MFQKFYKKFPVPFIVGAGRSGNTLLRLMLDSHKNLAIPPETDFIPELIEQTRLSKQPKQEFIKIISSHWRWSDCHIDKVSFIKEINSIPFFSISKGIRTFFKLYAKRFSKTRWGDKTPYYLHHMSLIQSYLPEARFIHIIRDGRDAALSTLPLWFGPNSIFEAAHDWLNTIEIARQQAKKLKFYLEIKYEDLIINSEKTLKEICYFIELDWDPNMLNYYKRADGRIKEVTTDYRSHNGDLIASVAQRHAIHALTSKPPQIERVNRWKTEMSHLDNILFVNIAGQLLNELGYEIN